MGLNILLVEPAYKSKYPPLGLMRISSFHKERGDNVSFVRGNDRNFAQKNWHRIYISSLFTYELPRTLNTINYYQNSTDNPCENIVVGGVGVTLLPNYISTQSSCKIVIGPLDKPGILLDEKDPISTIIPDYSLIDNCNYEYRPVDSYFVRISTGCIRKCHFCAVPIIEPDFRYLQSVSTQLEEVNKKYGPRKDLIIMDNNILALNNAIDVINEIKKLGFSKDEKYLGKARIVDFNQGIDARLITPEIAEALGNICVKPIRLALDNDAVINDYTKAVSLLVNNGQKTFTTYVMFNYNDDPISFYKRLKINLELSSQYDIRITGFPMKYAPINDVKRKYIAKKWYWKYIRGIQCILNATHGMVSPNPIFFEGAFGRNFEEFLDIIAMPERYIIYRNKYKNEALEWKLEYIKLSTHEKDTFLRLLEEIHFSTGLQQIYDRKFSSLLKYYFPSEKLESII
jgi:hypothetical protein